MPQLDFAAFAPQIAWLVITFAALYVIMAKFAVPRIADVLEARQKKIDDNLERAQDLRKEAEAAREAYEQALTDARAQAHEEIARVSQELTAKAETEETNLAAALDAKIAASGETIEQAMEDALRGVDALAADVASAAYERLTGDAADAAVISRAVQAELRV